MESEEVKQLIERVRTRPIEDMHMYRTGQIIGEAAVGMFDPEKWL